MSHLWDELYAYRLKWAEDAYTAFLNDIFPEKAKDFQNLNEVMIVVYGSTQVGKTTLILKLMGINEEDIIKVGNVLRGGREAGKSATVTAIRYVRSHDDLWYLDKTFHTEETIQSALREIRIDVENASYDNINPINIYIPKKYFSFSNDDIRVKILDLPGTHANNPHEEKYVIDIANNYIPYADLILLVGKADDLGYLTPEKLILDSLRSWNLRKNGRYRIVLTHTISPDSFMDWFRQQGKPNKKDVREYLLYEQIKTHDYQERFSEDSINYLYPLEFADSWKNLENNSKEMFEKAKPIIDEVFNELVFDIQSSTTDHGRIRRAFSMYHDVILEYNHEHEEYEHIKKVKEQKQEQIQIAIKRALDYIDKKNVFKRKKENEISSLNSYMPKINTLFAKRISYEHEDKTNKVFFLEWIEHIKKQISQNWRKFQNEVKKEIQIDIGTLNQGEIEHFFNSILKKLQSYTLDEYYPNLSDNYKNDKAAIEVTQSDAISSVQKIALSKFELAKKKKIYELSSIIKKVDYEIKSVELEKNNGINQLNEINLAIESFEKLWVTKEKKMKDRIESAKKFESLLDKAFEQEVGKIYTIIQTLENSADIFFYLCYVQLLYKEFDKLKLGENDVRKQ